MSTIVNKMKAKQNIRLSKQFQNEKGCKIDTPNSHIYTWPLISCAGTDTSIKKLRAVLVS